MDAGSRQGHQVPRFETRDVVVLKAREFLGTPFHHQGRVKGHGIDCVGLCVEVGKELGIYSGYDSTTYPSHPDGYSLLRHFRRSDLVEIPPQLFKAGDLIIFWIKNPTLPTHAGIVTDRGFIHTYANVGKVIEVTMHRKWRKRIIAAFQYPRIID